MSSNTKTPDEKKQISLVWLRRDLRLHEHAVFAEALEGQGTVQPVFVFDTDILSRFSDKKDRRLTFIMEALWKIHSDLAKQGSGTGSHSEDRAGAGCAPWQGGISICLRRKCVRPPIPPLSSTIGWSGKGRCICIKRWHADWLVSQYGGNEKRQPRGCLFSYSVCGNDYSSRIWRLRSSLRARRTASADSRTRFSEGFS